MLEFFRKYQSYIYAFITVVIIISFSFFGTYSAMPSQTILDETAFVAIDGTPVKRSQLEEMVFFLNSDAEDKKILGGIWGPNFLNDGVIKKDFLETGLAQLIVKAYGDQISQDLQSRLEKEKHFQLYTHPQAPFISMEAAWSYFSPNMKNYFITLQDAKKAIDSDAFNARIGLYLEEKKLPSSLMRQILRYQERQYPWIIPDQNLNHTDLSLFGYHSLEDWFGPSFVRLMSQFILNSSKIAEQKGYQVTRSEALADLMNNAEISFTQNIKSPYLGVSNLKEYIQEQLRRLSLDQNKAISLWQKVLLFRKMINDAGNSIVLAPLTHQEVQNYARETFIVDQFNLPTDLHLADYKALQKLEVYLDAVAKRSENLLDLPTEFRTVDEIKVLFPSLVQRRYSLRVAEANKQDLQNKISLKEIWNWELADSNWTILSETFPELALSQAIARDDRVNFLDALDDKARLRIDSFAREKILDSHPEWIENALAKAEPKKMQVSLRSEGGQPLFGFTDRLHLINLLNEASLDAEPQGELAKFSSDGKQYYRITVLEKGPAEEIMTFAEANHEGILDELLTRQLELYYEKIRQDYAQDFQKDDKTWKPLYEVKNQVADLYFAKILKAIRDDFEMSTENSGQQAITGDLAANARFFAYMRHIQDQITNHPNSASDYTKSFSEVMFSDRLPLADQWKLEKIESTISRSDETKLDKSILFALLPNQWSPVFNPLQHSLAFVQLKAIENKATTAELAEHVKEAQKQLAKEAKLLFLQKVLTEIQTKQAISLEYLKRKEQTIEQSDV